MSETSAAPVVIKQGGGGTGIGLVLAALILAVRWSMPSQSGQTRRKE